MSQEKVLQITDLSISFTGKVVLDKINLEVYRGQIIGYIGPNGAGKSTTVKIILGLLDRYRGKVEVFGEDIRNKGNAYKKRIGYVPENGEIYDDLTAFEYISFTGQMYGMEPEDIKNKLIRLLEKFDMAESLHKRVSTFSKGMKQKLLIISSLIHDPDLIFFDEPLSGLDANSVMIIKEMMTILAAEGKTIFYSSHIMDVVEKISNRIILLADGNVVADGTFDQLKEKNKEGTLEQIFNQLTGFDQHEQIAADIVAALHGDESNE
ncbi:ABC-2 type transport system ATP-binding protein [Natronobacillus azotifigens]|uniref:ABC transporter ATP-binding protein n=1 Tax=Natronobacillus azotifigens TaxID=472978 RepID=A0A9J6REY7_9BACI|nr:ABC transporter ATP-binding protein [Natronobacillus azotifigens]MCZ0704322.1 ABC transporter ATP-binding protein [Natronobacillus azotifigens]